MNAFQFGCAIKAATVKKAADPAWGAYNHGRDNTTINTPNGPGKLMRVQTLPKSDATARNWQGAPSAPPATSPAFQPQAAQKTPAPAPTPDLPLRKITPQQISDANTDYGRLPLRSIPQPKPERPPMPVQQVSYQRPAPTSPATPAASAAGKPAEPNEWLKMVRNMNNSVMPKPFQVN